MSVLMTLSEPNPGFKVYLYTYKSNISKTARGTKLL